MKKSPTLFCFPGDVKYAEIRQEKGRSIGQGLVRFSSEENAQHAISILSLSFSVQMT